MAAGDSGPGKTIRWRGARMAYAESDRTVVLAGMSALWACALLESAVPGCIDSLSAAVADWLSISVSQLVHEPEWMALMALGCRGVEEIIGSTGEAAFAVDRDGVIIAWNTAASRLFGYSAPEARGRLCWELLQGRDVFRNRYCCQGCPLREAAYGHEPVRESRLMLRKSDGERLSVDVFMLLAGDGEGGNILVHLCRPAESVKTGTSLPPARVPEAHSLNHHRGMLTGREIEVLSLLDCGKSTEEIASTLCLSRATVRNHVQHILFKLRVRSRIAAVSKARQIGLI